MESHEANDILGPPRFSGADLPKTEIPFSRDRKVSCCFVPSSMRSRHEKLPEYHLSCKLISEFRYKLLSLTSHGLLTGELDREQNKYLKVGGVFKIFFSCERMPFLIIAWERLQKILPNIGNPLNTKNLKTSHRHPLRLRPSTS